MKNTLTNLLGVALMLFLAYWSIHFDARPGEGIDSTDGMRTFLCLVFLGGTAWFTKETLVDILKLLRGNAYG